MTSCATVIGDVVDSRRSGDRRTLHRRLREVLERVNETTSPEHPLRITVGDEFQGRYADLGAALAATLLLRLQLLPTADLRHGVGWGPVTVLDAADEVEDGPGWWAARAAIEEAKAAQSRGGNRGLRTVYRQAQESTAGPDPGAVNAALITRDFLVGSLSERSVRLLRGLLAGETQSALAASEQVTASAVSQRISADGLGALVAAHGQWEQMRREEVSS